jgi:hypothetical protein
MPSNWMAEGRFVLRQGRSLLSRPLPVIFLAAGCCDSTPLPARSTSYFLLSFASPAMQRPLFILCTIANRPYEILSRSFFAYVESLKTYCIISVLTCNGSILPTFSIARRLIDFSMHACSFHTPIHHLTN